MLVFYYMYVWLLSDSWTKVSWMSEIKRVDWIKEFLDWMDGGGKSNKKNKMIVTFRFKDIWSAIAVSSFPVNTDWIARNDPV